MRPRSRFMLLAAMAAVLAIPAPFARATADPKSRFDLPAEALDKALRDFAVQAHCNISYEPAAVAGLQAPAVRGEFSPADALSLILAGTHLVAVNIDEDTIQVVEKLPARSKEAPGDKAHRTTDAEAIHLAHASAGTSEPPAAAGSSPDNADGGTSSSKKADEPKDLEEITVTGSHIRGVMSASPVIEIGREEIDRSGFTSMADLMLSVPQNFGGGYNPGASVGNSQVNGRYGDNPSAASVPNLRGLGPGSTLTLLDGHRMASGVSGGGADVSSIPLDAIERIEVVTDGASSIYGSDAVAGVVNILLKHDYSGAKTGVSYGLATDGGGTEKGASQTFGTSWSGGNILVAYEHRQQDAVDARDRSFTLGSLDPYTLIPATKSNSVTVTGTQTITPTVSAFIDGLYVTRDANTFYTAPGFLTTYDNPATLHKFAVTSGVDAELWGDWKLSVFANAAEDVTREASSYLTAPVVTPFSDERLLGLLRNLEVNANGSVMQLPSGPLRLAAGAGYQYETFAQLIGTTGQPYDQRIDGDRIVRYAFGELSLPLVEHSRRVGLNYIDLVVSGRYERYSDFGDKAVPKVGLVYAPLESVKIRSTWGRAFRAPNLFDIHSVQQLVALDLADPLSATGISPVLVKGGGNPGLRPETADTFSFGVDYMPEQIRGLQISTTFFDIRYSNRISQIANPFTALTDPLNTYFVTRPLAPGAAQSLYNAYPASEYFNATEGPFDVNSAAAVLDYREINVSKQTALGTDLTVGYRMGTASRGGYLFLNGAYLDLTQQNTPESPTQALTGQSFFPPKFRIRGGASGNWNAWALTGTANYLSRENNTGIMPAQSVGSWTTFDASLRYAPVLPGIFHGLKFSIAAINMFDRNPPRVLLPPSVGGDNLDYDASNASALGRYISVTASKEW